MPEYPLCLYQNHRKHDNCGDFAMMDHQSGFQPKLFYYNANLEKRVPLNHILRKIQQTIDFDFIYHEVKDTYGDNGNVSVPPPVINLE